MIKTENLSKQFGDFWAVDGVSITVQKGEILALLGQNGAGKTTTIRMLAALLHPTRGYALVAGYDTRREPEKVRASVGVLTEHHDLYGRMTAWEYLDFFGKMYGLDKETRKKRSSYLLERFKLADVAHINIGKYSKGMRQKLALARALIHEPPVLLLDEPTSAMDPESAQLVRQEILSLRSEQRSIIVCTHNLREAEILADKVAIIYYGMILVFGTQSAVKSKFLGNPVYEIRFSKPWHPRKFYLPKGVRIRKHTPSVLFISMDTPEKMIPLVLRVLLEQNAPILSIRESPRTLEQAYLKAMEKGNGHRRGAPHA